MPYWIHARIKDSAISVVVETAKDALAKLDEISEANHTGVTARDFSGAVVDVPTLEAEANGPP
jgi:hypothetical protein